MNWQVRFAIENIQKSAPINSVEHISNDAIQIELSDGAEVIVIISAAYKITAEEISQYHQDFPSMSFLCGYRKECIWGGGAIEYAENNHVGWGNVGTLNDAIRSGRFSNAEHKHYFFSYRLIRQMSSITRLDREFDRVFSMSLGNGNTYRVGMIMEYEPTADAIRTFWDEFGPIDVAWNINPSGSPTQQAVAAGNALGCKVVKWEELKQLMRNR